MMLFIKHNVRGKACWSARNLTACRKKVKELKEVRLEFEWAIHDEQNHKVESSGPTWVDHGLNYSYEGHLYG